MKALGLIETRGMVGAIVAADIALKTAQVELINREHTKGGLVCEDDTVPYYAHCVSRTGSYLSKTAGIEEGEALAYLIAPPLEAMYALDAALKAADVRLAAFFGPPSETNFGGGLLTGSQSACKSACDAFAEAVKFVAQNPKKI